MLKNQSSSTSARACPQNSAYSRIWPILAKMCLVFFCGGIFLLWRNQLAKFRDQSAMPEEHLSQKLMGHHAYNPKILLKMWQGGPKKQPIFFSPFRQKVDFTSWQNIPSPKNWLPKSFFLLELQEFEVRICVQPNFPIIILILLNGFHRFPRSRGLNSSDNDKDQMWVKVNFYSIISNKNLVKLGRKM